MRSIRSAGMRGAMAKKLEPYLFIAPGIIIISVLLLYPILLNVNYGFRGMQSFSSAQAPFVGLANYLEVIRTEGFGISVVNSIVFTAVSVLLQFGIGLPLAMLLNEALPGRGVARGLALVPWMIPTVVAALTWMWMLDGSLGIINAILVRMGVLHNYQYWLSDVRTALASVTVINIWKGIPFNLVVLLAGLQAIPKQLYEAAAIDGASGWKAFWRVTLPLLRPQFSVLLILGTIWTFRNFDLIFITTGGGPVHATEIMATLAYKYSFDFLQMGKGSAVANIMFLILMLITVLYAKFLETDTRYE
jgi:multiple sugar transport system permease protein